MTTILVHIGDSIQTHIYDCVEQFRNFNPTDSLVMLITDRLVTAFKEELQKRQLFCHVEPISRYDGEYIKKFESSFQHQSGFWNVTTKRIIYIYEFMKLNSIDVVSHFENDVMVYFPIDKYRKEFNSFSQTLLTDGSVDKIMLGFAVFKYTSLKMICDFILEESISSKRMNKYSYDFYSDMTILKVFSKEFSNHIEFLPTLPNAKNIEMFNSLFDPASWGQYLGGTNNGHAPGFTDPTHIIGSAIRNNPNWKILFGNNGANLVSDDKTYYINNLHVHCKQLQRFKLRK